MTNMATDIFRLTFSLVNLVEWFLSDFFGKDTDEFSIGSMSTPGPSLYPKMEYNNCTA